MIQETIDKINEYLTNLQHEPNPVDGELWKFKIQRLIQSEELIKELQ